LPDFSTSFLLKPT